MEIIQKCKTLEHIFLVALKFFKVQYLLKANAFLVIKLSVQQLCWNTMTKLTYFVSGFLMKNVKRFNFNDAPLKGEAHTNCLSYFQLTAMMI